MHRFITRSAAALALLATLPAFADVTLDGRSATPESIARIADGEAVAIAPAARERVVAAHDVLLKAAAAGQQIYGLTVGVGLNKDRKMVDAHGKLTSEVIDASTQFNVGLIRAHSGSVGPDMSVRVARAAMAARLNAMLDGGAGVQPAIVNAYAQFLNRGITPAMPADGSIGEADITILSHVGLAMLGEGDVYYQGRKLPAADALKAAGIATIRPYGKDALAILSSNAYSAGMAALALNDMARLARVSKLVFALSVQGLNGNVSPLREDTLALRPFPSTMRTGAALRTLLAGSSLWNRDADRPLQDPLSFRSGVYLLGEEDRTSDAARELLRIQLNSSDDNPGVAVGVTPKSGRAQDAAGYVDGGGAVLPSANFEPLPWVLAFEQLGLALGHNALACAQRIVKLNDPHLTGLSRFLGTDETVHAFGAMEKPPTALAMTVKSLATPVSLDYLPVAGGIEDIATNAPEVVQRVQRQIDASYALLGLELVQAAQAIDLRQRKQPDFTLAPATVPLYRTLRTRVAFLQRDRPLTADFRAADALLRAYRD
ncbi:HAL/PAL/TAL family ammonia-lyase [Burkholderia ubonensis]|uniref:HAL/PAL/TAL family ammonia-lyase n=1 Tax=Burkholderia ubonensis TaxID=101571 RepID=UPI000752E731|nr:aromatic amino acid ammonia-lyase [Burkholderia ubonensis]KVN46241.1 sugar transporter [Burkholderia ubonensis]